MVNSIIFKILLIISAFLFTYQATCSIYGDNAKILSSIVLVCSVGFWYFIICEPIIMQNAIIANAAIMAMWLNYSNNKYYFYLAGCFLIGISYALTGAIGLLLPVMIFIYFLLAQNNIHLLLNTYCIFGMFALLIGYNFFVSNIEDIKSSWSILLNALDEEGTTLSVFIDMILYILAAYFPFNIILPYALKKIINNNINIDQSDEKLSFLSIWFLSGPIFSCVLGLKFSFVIALSLFPFCIFAGQYLSKTNLGRKINKKITAT